MGARGATARFSLRGLLDLPLAGIVVDDDLAAGGSRPCADHMAPRRRWHQRSLAVSAGWRRRERRTHGSRGRVGVFGRRTADPREPGLQRVLRSRADIERDTLARRPLSRADHLPRGPRLAAAARRCPFLQPHRRLGGDRRRFRTLKLQTLGSWPAPLLYFTTTFPGGLGDTAPNMAAEDRSAPMSVPSVPADL